MSPSDIRRVVLPEDSLPQDEATIEDAEVVSEEPATPSWFTQPPPRQADVGELAKLYRESREGHPALAANRPEAYAHYRQLLEERFQSAKRRAEGPAEPIATMSHDLPPSRHGAPPPDDGHDRFKAWQDKVKDRQTKSRSAAVKRKGRLPVGRIAALFAGACVLGAAAGYGSSQTPFILDKVQGVQSAVATGIAALGDALPSWPSQTAQTTTATAEAQPRAGGTTVLPKKTIKTPRISVADASGVLNAPIPLSLDAEAAAPDSPLALKITGLPADAYLTKGTQVAVGEWMLKPSETNGVELVVPNSSAEEIGLSVAPIEATTGEPAAPPQELTVALDLSKVNVMPASAPPESQSKQRAPLPKAVPMPQQMAAAGGAALLSQGEALLTSGDVIAARQFFIKASEAGVAEGSLGVGRTYDPATFAELKIEGLEPDKGKAADWYRKAAAGGVAGAQEALEKLSAN
jgi:hypothetical protein